MSDLRVEQILTDVVAQVTDVSSASAPVTMPGALCAACAAALPVTGVWLGLMDERGSAGLVSATDGLATLMEELQFSLGEGPCVDSSELGRPVLQPELRETALNRWPGFGPAAVDAGTEAIFAFPLQVGGIRLGVLGLYRDSPGMLSADSLREVLNFADAAVWILLHLQDQMPLAGELHPDLGTLSSRTEVHQATGMVAVQASVGITEALLLLRARAYAEQCSILCIAHDVVSRTLRFPPLTAVTPNGCST